MADLIEKYLLSADIQSVQRGAVLAVGLIERFRSGSSLIGEDVLGDCAPTASDVFKAKSMLLRAFEQHGGTPAGGAVVWALGRLCDPQLNMWFRDALKHGLALKNDDLVYQALVALADIGEFRFPGGKRPATTPYRRRALASCCVRRTGGEGNQRARRSMRAGSLRVRRAVASGAATGCVGRG